MVQAPFPIMGCGCSRESGSAVHRRRVNPSESPGSTPERSWGSKVNGILTNGMDTIVVPGRPDLVHRGVDTRSLNANSRPNSGLSPSGKNGRRNAYVALTSTGTQCNMGKEMENGGPRTSRILPELVRSGSVSRNYSSLSRISELSSLAVVRNGHFSCSADNLPHVGSTEVTFDQRTAGEAPSSGCTIPVEDPDLEAAEDCAVTSEVVKMDAASQTEWPKNRASMDEGNPPEFMPRPPASRKENLLKNVNFVELDRHAIDMPDAAVKSVRCLVRVLALLAKNDLELVRLFYVWITHHIRYDVKFADFRTNLEDTLDSRAGVAKDYCQLFAEMCRLSDIRVEEIQGFAKGFDHNAGHLFRPGQDGLHSWNAVFLKGSWRLVDCTWGAGVTTSMGRFQRRFSEHYFLTDPEVFSWTHFPYSESEENYSRWQMIETPLTLDEFNALPKVFPHFFEYDVRIRTPVPSNPVAFAHSTEILLSAPLVLTYKYKLYASDRSESHRMNQYVFCQLRDGRTTGSFLVTPPDDGDYVMKVFARPERETAERPECVLNCVAVFALRCTRTWKCVPRYPRNDAPWGVTGRMAELGLKVLNLSAPVMVVVSGRKSLLVESTTEVLMTQTLTDVDGNEIDPKHSVSRIEDRENNVVRFMVQPPEVGLYKLSVYACPKPVERGKWRLPCVGTFLVDCKQAQSAAGELREQIFVKKPKKASY